ncbi:MAG: DUF1330 domain-containing protein [Alphaproteobacteria bacterium]|nr:DUF1330 domain-containing protein [Alphaproteobacteria bacterium]
MPAAYLIGQIEVTDPAKYEAYRKQVPATIAKFGGEYLVRGGALLKLEGQDPPGRTVVLRFPSLEQAKAWYHSQDYAGPKQIRQSASIGNVILVEGV